jgi:undecaprenyl-diphosphatase
MSLFHAIVLGLIQGLTEFLPVSSSAHLYLTRWLLNWEDPGLAFDVALHFGTLVAVLWFFRAEWIRLVTSFFSILRKRRIETPEERRVVYLVVATIPGALAGLALNEYAESTFRSPLIVGTMLIVAGLVLWLVDRFAPKTHPLERMTMRDALIVGLAQAFAIIPGVSRSGSTITAGRAVGLTREATAVFSFLLSMPIIAAAVVLEGPEALRAAGGDYAPLIVGVLASAFSGWLAISLLIKLVSRHSYGVFALYRFVVGIVILLLALSRG